MLSVRVMVLFFLALYSCHAFSAKASSMGRQVTRRKNDLAAAAEKCGFAPPIRPELHFYDARGTAATRLFQADASLREISTHMGWSVQTTAKMIETYVAMNPDGTDALLLKLRREEKEA